MESMLLQERLVISFLVKVWCNSAMMVIRTYDDGGAGCGNLGWYELVVLMMVMVKIMPVVVVVLIV